jgi:hypothetical protein
MMPQVLASSSKMRSLKGRHQNGLVQDWQRLPVVALVARRHHFLHRAALRGLTAARILLRGMAAHCPSHLISRQVSR